MRLFIVPVASEQRAVYALGAIEMSLPVVEVTQKTRGIDGVGMAIDEIGELADRAVKIAGSNELTGADNGRLLIDLLMILNRNEDAVCLGSIGYRDRDERRSRHQDESAE